MNKPVNTVLAFDFGLRQIGVAVGNCLTGNTQSLTVLHAKEGKPQWHEVEAVISEWQPELVVVGDPLNMDGSPGALSERADKFGRRLHGRFGVAIAMVDERLSSFEAKQDLQQQGHHGDYKRSPVDSYAAELILQTWMRESGHLD